MQKGSQLPSVREAIWVTKKEVLRNVPTLVLFWSMSCHSCHTLLKRCTREKWDEQFAFNFISVHMARNELEWDYLKLQNFCRQHQIHFPVIFDQHYSYADYFKTESVPTLYLFDSEQRFVRTLPTRLLLNDLILKARSVS